VPRDTTGMVTEIAFTAYPARDVAALRHFYTDALGLQFDEPYREDGVEKYAEARVGTGWFALMSDEWAGVPPGSAGSIAFEVTEIARSVEALRARGIAVDDPHDTGVCLMCTLRDPEGNLVTLHQRR
jgi:catechol 2,3-dioxygenase-like lactoylglutathione lyase family enzyme